MCDGRAHCAPGNAILDADGTPFRQLDDDEVDDDEVDDDATNSSRRQSQVRGFPVRSMSRTDDLIDLRRQALIVVNPLWSNFNTEKPPPLEKLDGVSNSAIVSPSEAASDDDDGCDPPSTSTTIAV